MPATATNKKQVTTTTTKKPAAKKPAASKTTSAVKKAVTKVAEGVKAKAAAPKKPATPKKPAESVEKAETQATVTPKPVVTELPIVNVEAPAAPTVDESPIEKVEPQDLSSKCSEVQKLLEFLLISKRLQSEPPYVELCNDLTELLSDCVDDEGKLLIQVKTSRPTKRTQSKVNGSSALRAFWAELIDRPEGGTV